jgi:hypothetical protein
VLYCIRKEYAKTPLKRNRAKGGVFALREVRALRTFLRLDVSHLQHTIQEMLAGVSPEVGTRAIQLTVWDVGKKIKTLATRAIREEYNVAYGKVLHSMSNPRFKGHGASISCVINVTGERIKIPNAGGGGRRKGFIFSRKNLRAKIAKGDEPLPSSGPKAHYVKRGGQVIVFSGGKFTMMEPFHTKNATAKKYPAKKKRYRQGVGIAVPQMPMTRSAEKIRQEVSTMLPERLAEYIVKVSNGVIQKKG